MPRYSLSSVPVRTLAVSAFALAALPMASRAQTPVPPPMRSEAMVLMQVCRGDYDRFCSDVQPGGGRILACLENHATQLSSACKQAMPRARSLKDSAAAAGVLPK